MSDILFTCPECAKSLAVDEAGSGRTIACSDCGAPISVPRAGTGFDCPECGVQLRTSSGLSQETFLCPACNTEIPLPDRVAQTEGGTIRVKRGVRVPPAPPARHAPRTEGSAGPPRLFSVKTPEQGGWPESHRVIRRLWVLVFGCSALLVLFIYMDVFFDAGLRVLSAINPAGRARPARSGAVSPPLDPIDSSTPLADTGPPPTWESPAYPETGPAEPSSPAVRPPDPPPPPASPVVAASTSTPVAVSPPPAPDDAELATFRDIYERQMLKLQTANRTNTLNWARAYGTTIERLGKNMQEAGDLDGWVAVGRERERFQADGTPPDSIGVTGSHALDAAFADARQRYDALADAHSKRVVSLGDNYISHLLAIQSRRTRNGDFRGAMRVNKEIKRVQKSAPRSAAEFRLAAAAAARRPVATESAPAAPTPGAADGTDDPPATPSVPLLSEPAIAKGRVRTPLPGVTFERLSVKAGRSVRSRRDFEVSVMRGISSNLQTRTSADLRQVDANSETALRHHVVVGLRTTSRTHIIKQPRIRIEYFVRGIGPAEGRSAPRRVTVDEVDLDTLDNEWVYIDCPPVETRQFTQSVEGNTFRRQSTGGERFHGVIVTVLQSRKRPVFEAVAAAAP